ncbi:MAG: C25 family cysteine peptidase, partial [Halobacteria archaeon]
CDTTLFSNGAHDFDAIAFDAAGNEATDIKSGTINNPIPDTNPPIVDIVKPDREWVHDLIQIEAIIQDTSPGYIQRVELYIDNVLVGRSIYPSFHINPLTGEVVTEPATSILTFTHLWNATGLEPSSEHTIEVKAWDNSGNYGHNSTRVKIFSIISIDEYLKMKEIGAIKIIDIEVTRNVVRHENWFDVSLTIRNIGNVALEHFDIRDPCMGFQAIALPMPATSRDTSVSYDRLTHRSLVRITPLMDKLNPGESWTFHYYAVPILFGSGRGFIRPHVIGGFETTVSFQCEGTDYHKIFRISQDPDNEDWDGNGRTELEDAFNSVDYLIITNPEKLFTNYPGDRNGVNLLLQEAAVLAKIKHGVLGYIEGNPSPESIKILLAPHLPSSWYFIDGQEFFGSLNFFVKRLPAFRNGSDAYLLIIGEDTIVPAKDVIGTIWGGEKWNWDVVFCSDNYYADVVNDDGMPDLIVGRIVGENASEFFKPIDVSISVYLGLKEFNYLNVLAISGPEEKSESFVKDVENVSNMLGRQGFRVDRVHTDTYYITENFLRKVLIMDRGMDKAYVNSLNLAELLNLISIEEAEQLEANRRGGFYLRYRDTLWNFNHYENKYELTQRAIAIKEKTLNKGVILWYGHGLAGGAAWADVLDSGENVPASIGLQLYTDYDGIGELSYVPIDFGRNCPIIFAWSCETGRYVKKLIPQPPSISTLPLYGMPEAFFHHGAAVYIGSTMTMGGSPTEESFIFFSRLKEYLESGRSIGLLFKDMKIAKHYYENRILKWDVEFAFEVNYYGDPKYGGQP